MSCIFCRIVSGEIPCHRVFADDHVLAFLDVTPLERGHVLVIPREHHTLFEELPDATRTALATAAARIAASVCAVTGATATTLAMNNGKAAGQEVPHCHLHVIPRRDGDGGGPIHALFSGRASASDLAELAGKLREAVK